MEEYLKMLAEYVALVLEMVAVLMVAAGGLEAAYRTLFPWLRGRLNQGHGVRRQAWLSLARWLLLGLEFMLAADIVRTWSGEDPQQAPMMSIPSSRSSRACSPMASGPTV